MRKVIRAISWGMISEGTFYGFLSMLVAEERVLNLAMPVSWFFFLVYLMCRCAKHYFPKAEERLVRVAVPCWIVAWFLITAATLVSSMAD